ncbi:MAG TPA: Uma2 family endonuclease [Verrucomicrobiae bacterium]
MPKVIDFGVAKTMGQQLTEKTLFTEFGAVIGTLEYMSPEQAEFNQLDIDTRSDIYSLGVLLYQLLTGTTPISRETVQKGALDELLRCIREQEPPKPSTRLSEIVAADVRRLTSKPETDKASSRRLLQEREQLTRLVRGDLDWIVMKALEMDRARRYDTANGLAMDIQRHLHDEPVLARSPSATYRLKKFARKHRLAVAAAAGFILLLTAATTVSRGLALWANREKSPALKAEETAKVKAKESQQVAQFLKDMLKGLAPTIITQEAQSDFPYSTNLPSTSKLFLSMSAILEIPEVRQRVSPLSLAEYHRLDELNERGRRTELIRGIVIEKMSKSPLHRIIASRLYNLFLALLPNGFSVWKEEPLALADSEPEPDISVVRGAEADFLAAHPTTAELVVEVAVSGAALDRENASLYAEAGVKEYWIVLGSERKVEIYRLPEGGRYQETRLVGLNDTLESSSVPGVTIRVADLFA